MSESLINAISLGPVIQAGMMFSYFIGVVYILYRKYLQKLEILTFFKVFVGILLLNLVFFEFWWYQLNSLAFSLEEKSYLAMRDGGGLMIVWFMNCFYAFTGFCSSLFLCMFVPEKRGVVGS